MYVISNIKKSENRSGTGYFQIKKFSIQENTGSAKRKHLRKQTPLWLNERREEWIGK